MQSPYIARTFGDGTNMTKIRKYELGWPNGLSIDFHTDRLFWVDAYFDRQGLSVMFSFFKQIPSIQIALVQL